MDVLELPLAQIIPYARNPRNNAEAIATVAASIQEFGWRQPIVVDEAMVVLAGHTRLEAARKLGFKSAPVHVAKGLTEAQARAFRIMDNRSSENAEWDKDLLNLELADLLEADFDLGLTGFTDDELNALMNSLEDSTGAQEGEDDIPDTPEDPNSRPGDLWVLGNHRLLCGDSTVATDIERLFGTVKPLLMVTDPPYGVEYDPSWRNQAGAAKTKRTGKVMNDDRADWREAWALFPGDVAYVWHGALHAATVAESLEAAGFNIRSQIIWAKERLVLSRGDYHWQHEPCQPAGTMVWKVVERGAGSQPAQIASVPIETLQEGDHVVSYNSYESVIRRRGRKVTRFGKRHYDGLMHTIAAAGRVTRATAEHRFSARLCAEAAGTQVVYLMRRGDWWRVGRVSLFNSRGFGLATRLSDNKADEAWIVATYPSGCLAQCAEQTLSCKYGIPTTHWEVDQWTSANHRSPEMISGIYAALDLPALDARASLLMRDHRLERAHPFISASDNLMFSRQAVRQVRACNLVAGLHQIPMPTCGDNFEWVTVTGNDAAPFSGPVYSMDVDKDQHYIADGLVTHNCWYAVKKTGKGHWAGDRKQTTLWQIPSKDQDAKTVHGTQKPVECMRRPILNNSSPGQAVYEPFMGSGTTLIAAETTGRVCYGIELNPAYVDVAVQRWQKFTGQQAVLDGDGKAFDALKGERVAA
ncbi:DNA adenine methyltransferase YhdJ [Aliiroseovarius sp. xm-v-208]|nr:DNA adenine methyltransferase YhdJ [Aliiroseovarius sp. xm-v-208]